MMRRFFIIFTFATLFATALSMQNTLSAQTSSESALPVTLNAGEWKAGHIQGVAVDSDRRYVYVSFTTLLVKLDMQGNVIGTVTGLIGHLGCLEWCEADGRLYGSLEYKNDAIGRPILERENAGRAVEDGFYVAVFDVDKINREGMNAERDGVMKTVFLRTVLDDYKASVTCAGSSVEHRYGCSGFDGISFGPKFGKSGRDGKQYLTIAYGIYGDSTRTDNDYQVLLQYDTSDWARYESAISQNNIHRNGPEAPDGVYFVLTGTKNWGVQQLEYDKHSDLWLLGTYKSRKPHFNNFTLFAVKGDAKPRRTRLQGVDYAAKQSVLPLAPLGDSDAAYPSIRGWRYDCAVGLCSLGDGDFFIAKSKKRDGIQSGIISRLRFTPTAQDSPFARY